MSKASSVVLEFIFRLFPAVAGDPLPDKEMLDDLKTKLPTSAIDPKLEKLAAYLGAMLRYHSDSKEKAGAPDWLARIGIFDSDRAGNEIKFKTKSGRMGVLLGTQLSSCVFESPSCAEKWVIVKVYCGNFHKNSEASSKLTRRLEFCVLSSISPIPVGCTSQ